MMVLASSDFNMPLVFAGLVLLASMGIGLYACFAVLERRLTDGPSERPSSYPAERERGPGLRNKSGVTICTVAGTGLAVERRVKTIVAGLPAVSCRHPDLFRGPGNRFGVARSYPA